MRLTLPGRQVPNLLAIEALAVISALGWVDGRGAGLSKLGRAHSAKCGIGVTEQIGMHSRIRCYRLIDRPFLYLRCTYFKMFKVG